jgi:hypothetical protein
MSYMRGDPYVYSSGDGVEIIVGGGRVTIDDAHLDALALMRLAEMMEDKEQLDAALAVVEEESGNFGGTALNRLIGAPGGTDILKSMVSAIVKSKDKRELYDWCDACGTCLGAKGMPRL